MTLYSIGSGRSFLVLIFVFMGLAQNLSWAKREPKQALSSPAFLPGEFAGWKAQGSPSGFNDAAAADPVNGALLKEYGFRDFEALTYSRPDGRRLTLRAARFEDASGALGAFTFYNTPQMLEEKIGDQGASVNRRVLFYKGDILVDALFERLSAMSAAELRELAGELPQPVGTAANLPALLSYLPKTSYVKNTVKYVVGPIGLGKIEAPLPPAYVNFSKGAEVVLGQYRLSGASATLMLIGYPTPQIAAEELNQIELAEKSGRLRAGQTVERRTGPIVVLAGGEMPLGDRKELVSTVNYEADVTWNEQTSAGGRDNVARLIVSVILLAAAIGGLSIVTGLAFGGFRLAVQRFLPGKVFDRPEQIEIISLHLSDQPQKPSDPGLSSSIKAG